MNSGTEMARRSCTLMSAFVWNQLGSFLYSSGYSMASLTFINASPALRAFAWMLELLKDVLNTAALLFSELFLITFV